MEDDGWTISEAVDKLKPRIAYRTLDTWIRVRLKPIDVRHSGKRGRPANVYDAEQVREVHAEIIRRRRKPGKK